MTENQISGIVIDAGIKLHRMLGPGLFEKVYEECLFYELKRQGVFVEQQKTIPLIYDGIKLEASYRIDLLVENKVVIELKSVEAIHRLYEAQVLNYLKLGNYKLGLLINFNTVYLKDGIKRFVNGL